MEKLIITCCPNAPLLHTDIKGLPMPITVREVADAAKSARDAGAAIVHIHEPITPEYKGTWGYNIEAWLEVRRLIQQESDAIFEHGFGGHPYIYCEHYIPTIAPELIGKYKLIDEKPELLVVLLGFLHHPQDAKSTKGMYVMPTREDLKRWMQICRDAGVKPSFENWQLGDGYNLEWMAREKLLDPPYWLTMFLGSACAVGSPPTLDDLLHRIKYLPEGALWQLSVQKDIGGGVATTQQQLVLLTHAIALGGHVRVGFEDNPYYWDGEPAKSNAQIIERIVGIARAIGREIATPDEARKMLGLPSRK